MRSLGIIGMGYVGQAVAAAYKDKVNSLICYDIDSSKGSDQFKSLFKAEAIFVCVPSPANVDGSCNGQILKETLDKLSSYKRLIISKTTATPDIYEKLGHNFDNLVYVPEFLTARNSILDYTNETSAIVGGSDSDYKNLATNIIKIGQSKITRIHLCDIKEAAFVKYVENCFLATKVVFMNEMAQLAQQCNLSWDTIAVLLQKDPRVGLSHCRVPGHDGQLGFGGHCFPKDTMAFLNYAASMKSELSLLSLAVEKNQHLRQNENS